MECCYIRVATVVKGDGISLSINLKATPLSVKGTTFTCIFKQSKKLVVYMASRMRNSIGHLKSVPLALFGKLLVIFITQN